MRKFDYLKLGASLYVPATHRDILAIANNHKLPHLRSVIFCLEDAVLEADVPAALANIERMLRELVPTPNKLRFIRVRNHAILDECLKLEGIEKIDGFVLPKTTMESFREYYFRLQHTEFLVMPTLETKEALDPVEMSQLRDYILEKNYAHRVLALRIGGNDLLNLFDLRRSTTRTMYDSPMRYIIGQLVACFRPAGFNLTSPVCELLFDREILNEEVSLDLEAGLFGKTAVHPDQIGLIEAHYKVNANQADEARAILAPDAPAVFRMNGRMCEPATHRNWAEAILARAAIYGIHGEDRASLALAA
jgi:citrate lyase beta subunit